MDIRKAQEKLKSMGFDPGEVDGQYGPNTARAVRYFQVSAGIRVSGKLDDRTLEVLGVAEDYDFIRRVIIHWTAGSNRVSKLDKKHYHLIVDGRGRVHRGTEDIVDNVVTADDDYAAHTLRLNTGSIGISVAGMRGALESPFDPGTDPLNDDQMAVLYRTVAELCVDYRLDITRETVLTHAEVEPTLGVRQRGKWDITWLPEFGEDGPRDPVEVGDLIRERVRYEFDEIAG